MVISDLDYAGEGSERYLAVSGLTRGDRGILELGPAVDPDNNYGVVDLSGWTIAATATIGRSTWADAPVTDDGEPVGPAVMSGFAPDSNVPAYAITLDETDAANGIIRLPVDVRDNAAAIFGTVASFADSEPGSFEDAPTAIIELSFADPAPGTTIQKRHVALSCKSGE